jgi:hypothetical protein
MRSLLLVDCFDFRPSNQYISVRSIPSCFRFAKMCLCQFKQVLLLYQIFLSHSKSTRFFLYVILNGALFFNTNFTCLLVLLVYIADSLALHLYFIVNKFDEHDYYMDLPCSIFCENRILCASSSFCTVHFGTFRFLIQRNLFAQKTPSPLSRLQFTHNILGIQQKS